MAEHTTNYGQQPHTTYGQHRPSSDAAVKSYSSERGPGTSQVLAVVTLLPVGGALLGLAGITLIGTLIGLAVAFPLFVIFSPVLVPAVLALGLAVTGFLTSGAFGVTALSSLSWIVNYVRQMREEMPDTVDYAKRRVQDTVGHAGQKTKELAQRVPDSARS